MLPGQNQPGLKMSPEIKVHDLTSISEMVVPVFAPTNTPNSLFTSRAINTSILKFTLLWTGVKLFREKVQTIFSCFLFSGGDSGNLQSVRQQRRNLIPPSCISGGRVSPRRRLLSSIWNMKPDSSTAAPLGLNIHMFCEMLEMVQVRNPQGR